MNDIFHTLQSNYLYALICVSHLRNAVFNDKGGLIAVDPDFWTDIWNGHDFNTKLDKIEEMIRCRMEQLKGETNEHL